VGIVLQSRLFRTENDIHLLPNNHLNVRLVKGIYIEAEAIAYTSATDIRNNYIQCAKQLFAKGAYVALATHDEIIMKELLLWLGEQQIEQNRYEWQLLLGVKTDLSRWLKQEKQNVRVYVPYGSEWRAYSLRRLRKNPQLLKHILKDTLGSATI